MFKSKSAIGPVIAISLLLVVGVVAVISFQQWYQSFQSETLVNVESNDANILGSKIETVIGDKLYLNYLGTKSVLFSEISFSDINCIYGGTLDPGMNEILVIDCDQDIDALTGQVQVSLVSDSGIISNYFYIDNSLSSINSSNFVSVWDTTLTTAGSSNPNQIKLPIHDLGSYNFSVDWGDGSNDTITAWNDAETTHTYSSEGIYELDISGEITGFMFNNTGDRDKILEIKNWGPLRVGNTTRYFHGCSNLLFSGRDSLNLTGTTNLEWMFYFANNFDGDLRNWDVSSVTDISLMFGRAYNFNSDLSNWDVSSAIDFSYMFYRAYNFNSDLSNWDVSSANDMLMMFYFANNFNSDLNNWDVSSVTDISFMFGGTNNFNGDLSDWDVSSVVDMEYMFFNASSFNQDLSLWNVSLVTDMKHMFTNASSFNQDLSSWDVDQVTNCSNFNTSTPAWVLPKPNFSGC